jgi:hypothetical protein
VGIEPKRIAIELINGEEHRFAVGIEGVVSMTLSASMPTLEGVSEVHYMDTIHCTGKSKLDVVFSFTDGAEEVTIVSSYEDGSDSTETYKLVPGDKIRIKMLSQYEYLQCKSKGDLPVDEEGRRKWNQTL